MLLDQFVVKMQSERCLDEVRKVHVPTVFIPRADVSSSYLASRKQARWLGLRSRACCLTLTEPAPSKLRHLQKGALDREPLA